MIAERTRQSLLSHGEFPCDSTVRCEKPDRTLITDEPWDCYHLESLLPLKETYRENTEFGFLLRHYWIPATILTFRQSSRTTFPRPRGAVRLGDRTPDGSLPVERVSLAREDSSGRWRWERQRAILSEMLWSYDCYEQTFWSDKPILFALPTAEQRTEARRQALYRLSMLCPPGPVPIGFSWHAKVGDDYMNFRLEAEKQLGETSVLVIRRQGRYTLWLPEKSQQRRTAQPRHS